MKLYSSCQSLALTPYHSHKTLQMAVRLALVLSVACLTNPLAATAAESLNASNVSSHKYSVAAGQLGEALNSFARQANITLSFTPEQVQGLKSPGIKGNYSLEAALNTLLIGSELQAQPVNNGSYILKKVPPKVTATPKSEKEETLSEVTVTAQQDNESARDAIKGYVAKVSSTSTKTDTPILETPQSISVITSDEMNAHKVQTLTEAVAYTPGVRVGAFGFDPRFDSFSIRGFDATYTSIYRDGLRELSSNFSLYKEEPYSASRIDVIKGPSSALYGQSQPGGLINISSKLPSFISHKEMEVQVGNYDRKQGQFDFTGAVNDSSTLAYRLTGLVRNSESPIPGANDDRTFIAPALTWRPDENTSLTILTQYLKNKTIGNPSYVNLNGTVLTNLPSGDPAYQDFKQEQYQIGYLFEHKFNDQWTFRQNFRTGHIALDAGYTQIDSIAGSIASRSTGRLVEDFRSYALDNQAQWEGNTGAFHHTVLFGVDWTHSLNNGAMGFGSAPDLDLTTLNYGTQPIDSPALTDPYTYRLNQVGAYAQDQIKWNQWILTLSGREDASETSQNQSGAYDENSDHKFTGRAGLGYLFKNGVSPYVSYSTSFVPVVGKDSAGGFFKPTTGKQVEAGVKYQPENINALITASVFQITQQNVVLASGPFSQTQAGEVRSRGFEIEAKANLTKGLNVTAAYTHILPKFNSSDDVNNGNTLSGEPKNSLSLWGDYTLPSGILQGVGIGAGMRHLGTSLGDDENTFRNNSVTLFDMTAHYDISDHWRLSVNANNLSDKEYTTCSQAYCYVGQPRTVISSLRYVW